MKLSNVLPTLVFSSLASISTAFVTPTPRAHASSTSVFAGLEEVDASDPFETYEQTAEQKLAVKDTVIGSGEIAETGKVVTVAYTGRLMATNKQFDSGAGYSFTMGEGRVMPGWEQGLLGMKVGGKRTLRIPPALAYADRGRADAIPPNSHLEFDCELVSIANGPIEEVIAKFNIQKERVITFVLLMILLAASPTFG